jgi:hypothetical protein
MLSVQTKTNTRATRPRRRAIKPKASTFADTAGETDTAGEA